MNILLITTIYPRDDAERSSSATKVAHYFAQQWIASGHNVLVVHCPNRMLYITYCLPHSVRQFLKAKTGNEFPDRSITKKRQYVYEGVKVFRRPVFKLVPQTMSGEPQVKKCAEDVKRYLSENGFVPDYIIGHWETPTIQLICELKKEYNCRTSVVFHGEHYAVKYPERIAKLLEGFDAVGARSLTSAEAIRKALGLKKTPFVCCSGIPDDYIGLYPPDFTKFKEPVTRFIFVGTLIKRKNCDSLIRALANQESRDWTLDIVGDGAERENLEKLAVDLGVGENVTFRGRVERSRVIELMQGAQCFIMNSVGEVFGLVYLEAMLASCITVGSLKEGMDGIITDGSDGFLVNAGDSDELTGLIGRIRSMDSATAESIAKKGYENALKYTDSAVAERYLKSIDSWRS